MNRRLHALRRRLLLLGAASLALPAAAQSLLPAERDLAQPVAPGAVAPWRPPSTAVFDPGETGTLASRPAGRTLADWYAQQGSPVVVVLIDRRLERLPADWYGTARLVFQAERQNGGRTESEQLSIGVERKSPQLSQRDRRPLVKLLENAVLRELQLQQFQLVDPSIAERALSARSKGGDTEFLALKGAAAFLLEIEFVPSGNELSLIGSLKQVGSGQIVASVRQPVEQDLAGAGTDLLARAFVKRLLGVAVAT